MKKKTILLILLTTIFFLGAACGGKSNVTSNDGGVFRSLDNGVKWEQKVGLLSVGMPRTIGGLNVGSLIFDPQDNRIIYLLGREGGLFISHNRGDAWLEVDGLPKGRINSLVIDPRAKNVSYAAVGGKVFKSTDCCRSWQNIYLDGLPNVEATALAVDFVDNQRILVGLSDGRLIRSADGGINWATFYDFKHPIKQILINPKNTGIIYLSAVGGGLWRSGDGGAGWQSLDTSLKSYRGGGEVDLMVFNPNTDDGLIMSTAFGLLRTENGGQSWVDYKLLFQPNKNRVTAFTFNPKNPSEVYCTTATTLYRSSDGGINWQTKGLPSKRSASFLLLDSVEPNILYLGLAKTIK